MSITIFGYFWLSVVLIALLSKNNKNLTIILLISMILQSNTMFIINGDVSIGPQIVTSTIFLLRHISSLFKGEYKYTSQETNNIIIFVVLVTIILYSTIINRVLNIYTVLNIMMLLIYYLVFLILSKKNLGFHKQSDILSFVSKLSLFIIFIGVWQLLVEYSVLPSRLLLETFIYSDKLGSVAFNTKNVKRFYSSFMEPAYTSAYLVGVISYFTLSNFTKSIGQKILMFLLLISLILTKSTIGYLSLLIIIFYWILFNSNLSMFNKITIVYLLLLFILIIVTFNPNLFLEVLLEKGQSASFETRDRWNIWAIEAFKTSPYYGVGFKQQRGSSLGITLLAELGFLGLSAYVIWVYSLYKTSKKNNVTPMFSFILSVVITQMIGSPDLSFSVFWVAIYLFGLNKFVNKYNY